MCRTATWPVPSLRVLLGSLELLPPTLLAGVGWAPEPPATAERAWLRPSASDMVIVGVFDLLSE